MMEEYYDAKSRPDLFAEIAQDQEQPVVLQEEEKTAKKRTPAQANYPEDDETYPFLDSITTLRAIKGYVNDENLMPTTTYSFLVSNRMGSVTNIINAVVLIVQVSSYAAVVASVIDFESENNPFRFPPNVTSPVRASQLLSLVYSILVQDSIVRSLYTFRNGFDEAELRRAFPRCAKGRGLKVRWYVCLIFLLCLGIFAQSITFIMIMQSEDVLGVLLNYAAVNFIATIDDRIFFLGKRGWFGPTVERNVRLVSLADDVRPKPEWYRRYFHSLAMLGIFGALLGLWIKVVSMQTSGQYLPRTVFVEFGDAVNPALGTFGGFYDILPDQTDAIFATSHATYVERRSGKSFFGYCPSLKVWTFTYDTTQKNYDACRWDAKSAKTEKFDLVTTVLSDWSAKSPVGREVPMDRMDIRSWSCTSSENPCGPNGQCQGGKCLCDQDHFGIQCEFPRPCTSLEVDGRFGPFEGIDRQWSRRFEIVRLDNQTMTVYDMPVYMTRQSEISIQGLQDEGFDVIFFTGRRWALAFSDSFDGISSVDELVPYFENFHAHFENYTVGFLSEPITDIKKFPSPDLLSWLNAQPHVGKGIQEASTQVSSAILVCSECNEVNNPCFYDGVCNTNTTTCECSLGSEGGMCEVPPIGNGRCDVFFNTLEFDHDGGDCCEATCVSSEDVFCGRDATGFLDTGFFFCSIDDPIPSGRVKGEPFSESGRLIAMSQTGAVLAASISKREVGLYDKEGAEWTERTIIRTCPIEDLSLASGPYSSNPIFLPPVVVAVACRDSKGIQTYICTRDGCSGGDINTPNDVGENYGDTVHINRDGGLLLVSSVGSMLMDEGGFVDMYRAELDDDDDGVQWTFSERVFVNKDMYRNDTLNAVSSINSSQPLARDGSSEGEARQSIFLESWHEAEDAILENAVIDTQFSPFSGNGYVDMLGPGASLTWTTEVMTAGTYEVSISYASPNDRPAKLIIDGDEVDTFQFQGTNTWTNWTVESVAIWLSDDRHIVELLSAESNGANIDWMTMRLLSMSEFPSSLPTQKPSGSPSESPSSSPTVTPPQFVAASSLSGDGNILAIVGGDLVDILSVRVYAYQFNGTDWLQLGPPIRETLCSSDVIGKGIIDLSFDGLTVMISTGSSIKVHDWNETAKSWNQRGDDITVLDASTEGNDTYCYIEYSALASDGEVVAANIQVSGDYSGINLEADPNGNFLVVTLAWEESSWLLRERNLQARVEGSKDGPIALSGTGNQLAVGQPLLSADLSGSVVTYEYPGRGCKSGFDRYRITFTAKPKITEWLLYFSTVKHGNYSIGGGPYYFPDFPQASESSQTQHEMATIAEDICVPVDEDRFCTVLIVYPTDFGGFNIIGDGVPTFQFPQSDEVIFAAGDNCTEDDRRMLQVLDF